MIQLRVRLLSLHCSSFQVSASFWFRGSAIVFFADRFMKVFLRSRMGWMLSSMGTALETYGLVAGAAINRQAENTQIQGIYNAEQTAARKSLEAANQSTDARLVSSVAGVEGGLTTSLGQIRANQVTQTLLAEASKNYGLSSSAAATKREIAGTLAEAQGTKEARTIDGMKEVELRGQGNLERFGMKTYEFTPGGSSIAGTSVPIRTGQELFDWSRNKHPIQEVNKQMDSTTRTNIALQNNNTHCRGYESRGK